MSDARKKVTVPTVLAKKNQEKLVMTTAYDAAFACMMDKAGVDMLLVGDSLGMVIQGDENTLRVTVDDVAYHTKAVKRGTEFALVIADMPFLSYQVSDELALLNAGKLIQAGAAAVKIEGGYTSRVRTLVEAGIPVMGHVGLLPQSVHAVGGFKLQGKNDTSKKRILEEALALEAAGVFAVVIEAVPKELAKEITSVLKVPTIGIGAGVDCDGQVLVCYDLLGMTPHLKPKFVKRYANFFEDGEKATRKHIDEVKQGTFPDDEHSSSDVNYAGR